MTGLCGNDCERCVAKERCGGCSLCERVFCKKNCESCVRLCLGKEKMEPLLRQIRCGALELRENRQLNLPPLIPIIPDHQREAVDVGDIVGVHGFNAMTANGENVARVYRIKGVRDTLNLAKETPAVWEFYVPDRILEGFWANRYAVYRQLARLNPKAVISPNFSVYDDTPRSEHIFNIWRSVAVYNDMVSCGLPAVPDVSWNNLADLSEWAQAINEGNVHTIAFNFQTVSERFKPSNEFIHSLAGLKYLTENIPKDTNIILSGLVAPTRVQLVLRECENRISVLNQTAYIHSRKGIFSETRKKAPDTMTKAELLMRNNKYFSEEYTRKEK